MFRNYFKVALAVFKRRKVFTAISLFGITFTLTILLISTSILDHIFGGVAPEVHQGRTLGVFHIMLSGEGGRMSTSLSRNLLDRTIRDLPGAERVSIVRMFQKVTSFVGGERIESFLRLSDADFWEILEFEFIEGRGFTSDEVESGAMVAVINVATRNRFFADGSALGETIEANGRGYRVIGVVENVPFFRLVPFSDIWAPLSTESNVEDATAIRGSYTGLILARSRRDFSAIRDEFVSRLGQIDLSGEGRYDTAVAVPETPFQLVSRMLFAQGSTTDSYSTGLLILVMILMMLFMVLPTINLVNLNISRIMERASEIGVRKAFGAPSLTLIGQFTVENLILTLGGSALALVLSHVVLGMVSNSGLIPYATFHLNIRVFFYALATAVVFGLISGVYPAWRMSRMHPVDALRGGVS